MALLHALGVICKPQSQRMTTRVVIDELRNQTANRRELWVGVNGPVERRLTLDRHDRLRFRGLDLLYEKPRRAAPKHLEVGIPAARLRDHKIALHNCPQI